LPPPEAESAPGALSEPRATLERIANLPCVRVFAFDDEMLNLANQLAFADTA
jgi:hypothetical protein